LKKSLRVVSLFDGICCGRVALEQAGYAVSYYAAFEIDKYAISISRYNFPDIIRCGDVMDADFRRFSNIDLLIGGSPCTTFSVARSKGRETEKGGAGWELFMKYAKALKVIKPCYFMYENVASMHKNIRNYISEELGCEPIMLNSALVSAQQRKRLYWTNSVTR
jgi:DNA (cytosine-5)-methyltransferase 3A